jgi:hypothetical protein
MATLNSSNIVNGNVVETTDILQLYDALTAGGGTTGVYNVSISGSLTGSATSASNALSASFATSASFAISSSRAISSSFATTASFALNATTTVSQVNDQYYIDSSNPSIVSTGNFKFIAGGGTLNAGSFTSSIYPSLVGRIIGQNAWINASYIGDTGTITATEPTLVINLSGSGQIIIDQLDGSNDATIVWTGVCL